MNVADLDLPGADFGLPLDPEVEAIEFGAPTTPPLIDPELDAFAGNNGNAPAAAAEWTPFTGLSHEDVLALELPPQRYLVDGLVPVAAVGTIAGVPETHKSWLAQAIAVRVAAGHGAVLGCDVTAAGRVGYFWQDDSTREEAERVKLFHQVHSAPADISLRWYLNEGLELPRDFDRLYATVTALDLDLVVLDSFYNFLPGIDLKDAGAEDVVKLLKRDIADRTGCTVLIVDHMPWATETNRQRLRAYGGVHKNAATRFGIYIDAIGKSLSIEARGNNIAGFKKRPAYWDADALELRLVDATDHDETVERRAADVLAHLIEHPGSHTTTKIREAVGGRQNITDAALELLKARAEVSDHGRDLGPWSGKNGAPRYWIASIHAGSRGIQTTAQLFGPGSAEVAASPQEEEPRPEASIGAEVSRAEVEEGAA